MVEKQGEKILIFIVAYNAEKHIEKVLQRIPNSFLENYNYEILIIDDKSQDATFQKALEFKKSNEKYNINVLYNPINQRYGGNQKLGYHYAIEHGFDYVVLLHGDGQYAPELIEDMIQPLLKNEADCVMGSRMMVSKAALKGGMPLYKYIGNKILTNIENKILNAQLTEFHSGYRAYSTKSLKKIPFEYNSNDFNFDTQIIIQLLIAKHRIVEIPIPTYYGDEICHVNGLKYAKDILINCLQSKLHGLNIFYRKEYDIVLDKPVYDIKLGYTSSHTLAIDAVEPNSKVLDLGCGKGLVAQEIRKKNCSIIGVDMEDETNNPVFEKYYRFNLDFLNFEDIDQGANHIIMLDIIEHLKDPEDFLYKLRKYAGVEKPKIIITTPNIAFAIIRIQLLLGQFNYGKKGILDLTHTRLFTFKSLKNTLTQNGYEINSIKGVPAPFPIVFGNNFLGKMFLNLNKIGIFISKSFFSYQIYVEATPLPTVDALLNYTKSHSELKKIS